MDRKRKEKKSGFFGNIGELIRTEIALRKNDKGALISDVVSLTIAFVFARCHVAFGAYPLHIAFLSVLPSGVWTALIGGVVGSLSLGGLGIAGALAAIVTVFLRAALSSMHRNSEEPLMFREPLLFRISSAIIGAFVGGIYIIIDTGLGFSTVLCLLSFILLSCALSFVFYGAFDYERGVYDALGGDEDVIGRGIKEGKGAFLCFSLSFLAYVFFISMALSKYDVFGISPAYVFSSALTLFFARRFGKIAAMSVGFVSSFLLSPLYSVGFALMGLASGALFSIGVGYGVLGGGIAVFLWSLYTGGAMGLLSVLPEYSSAAILITPILKRTSCPQVSEKKDDSVGISSREMVNTTVMAYISKRRDDYGRVSSLLEEMADVLKKYVESIPREEKNGENESSNTDSLQPWSEYELLSKIISEVGLRADTECSIDEKKSEAVEQILTECGMYSSSAIVIGDTYMRVVFAGEDKDGSVITSNLLHGKIEECLGVRLGSFEYYRKGEIALCEAEAASRYRAEYASVGERGDADVVSGDNCEYFTHENSVYSLISDGMGSGELAASTSRFVCDFLRTGLRLGAKKSTLFHALNKYLLECKEECSASVDLFEFDTVRGLGCFYKCGAADSYVKRDNSIFRIRSETAPIGLMSTIDAEKIRVEVKAGDVIIMISDGINQPPIDAAWLLEKLHESREKSLTEYAYEILCAAEKNNKKRDDMTVSVVRICERKE